MAKKAKAKKKPGKRKKAAPARKKKKVVKYDKGRAPKKAAKKKKKPAPKPKKPAWTHPLPPRSRSAKPSEAEPSPAAFGPRSLFRPSPPPEAPAPPPSYAAALAGTRQQLDAFRENQRRGFGLSPSPRLGRAGLHCNGLARPIALAAHKDGPRVGAGPGWLWPAVSLSGRCDMPTYNILLMGASYGSLLASKLLFGGHKLHLVCLPAEADLINAEGFRVRLPVRGRKDPVELDSRNFPAPSPPARPRASIPKTTIWSACACRSRNTARPACANCSTRSPNRACRACRS